MESLGKIFGSTHRVKIMRLFLFNETIAFDRDDIVSRARVKKTDLTKELGMLTKIGFLKKKVFLKKVPLKTKTTSKDQKYKQVRVNGWILNQRFDLIYPLRNLLIEIDLVNEKDVIKRIRKSGNIKLLILSGLFVKDDNRMLDVLVVGEKIKRDILAREMAVVESEVGRELRYAFFDVAEFRYRTRMYDKLVRDIIENDHIKLIDVLSK